MIIGAVSPNLDSEKESFDAQEDILFLQYGDTEKQQISGIRFSYGAESAYGMVKRRKGEWNRNLRLWTFQNHDDAKSAVDAICKKHPKWPVRSNLDSLEIKKAFDNVSFSKVSLSSNKCCLVLPLPLPFKIDLSVIRVEGVTCVKVMTKKKSKTALLIVGDASAIETIEGGMKSQGAKNDNSKCARAIELNHQLHTPIKIKVNGWAVEIICDLSQPLHYLVKPEQEYIWDEVWPYGKKSPIQWSGSINTTRRLWPSWEKKIQDAGLEWEGDNPSAEISTGTDADFTIVPGWNVPAANGHRLHNYQKEGVEFCVNAGMRVLVGDEMGIGKTAQAIAAIESIGSKHIVVTCPANARYVWDREIKGWSSGGVVQHIVNKLDPVDPDARWHIVTFDQLVVRDETWEVNDKSEIDAIRSAGHDVDRVNPKKSGKQFPFKIKIRQYSPTMPEFQDPKKLANWGKMMKRLNGELMQSLLEIEPDIVIVDEAHRVKNKEAKRTESVRKLTTHIPYALLLTGTPLRNNEHEAAVLLSLLDAGAGIALNKSKGYTIQDVKDYLEYFMIRRTKVEVLPELPPKTRQRIDIDNLDSAEQEKYFCALDIAHEMYAQSLLKGSSEAEARRNMLGQLEKARVHLGLAKVLGGDVSDLVVDVVENKGCAVVFCAHHIVSDTLLSQLFKAGLKAAIVDGRTGQMERAKIEKDFQESRLDVFIGGIHAGGEAITLTRSDTVIFVELDWVPGALLQAEDRIHRVGQLENCQVIHLIAKLSGTNHDNEMIKTIGSKLETIGNVLGESTQNLIHELATPKNLFVDKLLAQNAIAIACK